MADKDTTTKFKADISELNKAFKQAQAQIRLANSEFKAASAGLNDWANNADGVSAKLKQLNSNLGSEKQKLESLENQLARTAEEYGENSKEVQELTVKVNNQKARVASTEKEIGNYNQRLKDMAGKAEEAEPELEALSKDIEKTGESAEKSHSKLESFAKTLGNGYVGAAKVAGKSILAVVTAMGAIGTASVKAGADFDAQMSTVASISGATESEFETLRAKALEMGSTTSFSATESAQALEYMAMAGWDTQQMTSGLAGVMNLAAASGESLAATSDIVTDAMTALGMQAEESSHFSDVLAKTASSANTNVSLLGESFKYCAPVAGALGASAEDLSIALGLMANSGIKGSQAGTSLANALVNMSKPTSAQTGAMENLGIEIVKADGSYKSLLEIMDNLRSVMGAVDVELVDSEGNMRDIDDIMNDLSATTDGLTQSEQLRNAGIIFGKQNLAGMLAIINATDKDYQKLTESIYDCTGTAKEMSEVKLDNLSGDVTLFKSALEGAEIAISDQLSPVLRKFVQEATKDIPHVQDYIADFGGTIANVASGLLPIIKKVLGSAAPLLKDIGDEIADILPIAADIISDILPPMKKAFEIIIKHVSTIVSKLLPPLANLIEAITNVLNPLLDVLAPILEVVGELASLVGGVLIDSVASFIKILTGQKDEVKSNCEVYDELVEKQKTMIEQTNNWKQETEELNKKRYDLIENANAEYGYYQSLADELSTIVDENGKVKEGYEERAKVITNELSNALGTEIEINDGVIQSYKDVQKEIEKTIELKKGQSILDSMKGDYTDAILKQQEVAKAQTEAAATLAETQHQIDILDAGIAAFEREIQKEDYIDYGGEKYANYLNMIQAREDMSGALENQKGILSDLNDQYNQYQATVDNYEALSGAVMSGNAEDMDMYLLKLQEGFITIENGTKESLLNQVAYTKRHLDEVKSLVNVKGSGITQENVKIWEQYYKDAFVEANKIPGMTGQTIHETVEEINSKASEFTTSGETSSDAFKNAFMYGLEDLKWQAANTAQSIANDISSVLSSVSVNASVSTNIGGAPKTATGGIVTRAQTRIVGEDGAEAIVPLEKNTKWIDLVAAKILGSGGLPFSSGNQTHNNTTNNYFTQNNTSPKALSNLEIYRQSKRLLDFKGR